MIQQQSQLTKGNVPKNPFKAKEKYLDQFLLPRVQNIVEEKKQAIFYILLCPNYPNNGQEFTYTEGKITVGLPPNFSRCMQKLEQNIAYMDYLHQEMYGDSIEKYKIKVVPLVCDIEHDLAYVTKTFAHSESEFKDLISQTAAHIQEKLQYLQEKYHMLVQSGTFEQHLTTLPQRQEQYKNTILPLEFLEQVDKVAKTRGETMFRHLYGAQTHQECIAIAQRQMINYLAVDHAIYDQDPGAVVINDKSPNLHYVSGEKIPEILGIDLQKIPLFQVLS